VAKTLMLAATAAVAPPPRDRQPVRSSGRSTAVLERGEVDQGLDATLTALMQETIAVCEEVEQRRAAVDNTRESRADFKWTMVLWQRYEEAKRHLDDLQDKVAQQIGTLEAGGAQIAEVRAAHRPVEPGDSGQRPAADHSLLAEQAGSGHLWEPAENILETSQGNSTVGGRALEDVAPKAAVADGSEETPIARSAQRQADVELVAFLRAQDFAGVPFERFLDRLARYGLSVVGSWVGSGDIFVHCLERDVKGLSFGMPRSWSAEDLDEIVQDTVAQALVKFETDALRGGHWDPDGGASLASYFIGACIYVFADVYRRRIARWQRDLTVLQALTEGPPPDAPDPAETTVERDLVQRILKASPGSKLERVLHLSFEGYTHEEIATELGDGTTPRAIEGMLYRHRKQFLRQERNNDGQ
jgi:DNA-directed RNA polymerase specialized sigma24 family protein